MGKTYHSISSESSCKAKKSKGLDSDRPVTFVEYQDQEVVNEGSTSDLPSQTFSSFQ